jgi:hypothetical protein
LVHNQQRKNRLAFYSPACFFYEKVFNILSTAAHRVAAIVAFIAGAVSDGYSAANIAGGGIVRKMLKLGAKLLHNSRLGLQWPGLISNSRAYLW